MSDEEQDSLREALKRTAVTLKEAGVPFALAGGYAAWVRGGAEPDHDVDFVVTRAAAAQADLSARPSSANAGLPMARAGRIML